MPYSILLFLTRKPDITPDAFKSHYESIHVPLLQSIAGPVFPNTHTRRYIQRSKSDTSSASDSNIAGFPASVLVGAQSDFEYDAIAEATFDDEKAFQVFYGVVSHEEAASKIAKDEELFLDRTKTTAVVLGDCIITGKRS